MRHSFGLFYKILMKIKAQMGTALNWTTSKQIQNAASTQKQYLKRDISMGTGQRHSTCINVLKIYVLDSSTGPLVFSDGVPLDPDMIENLVGSASEERRSLMQARLHTQAHNECDVGAILNVLGWYGHNGLLHMCRPSLVYLVDLYREIVARIVSWGPNPYHDCFDKQAQNSQTDTEI